MTDNRYRQPCSSPRVFVRKRGEVAGIAPRTVARRAGKILEILGEHEAELSVLLVTDAEIHALNRKWRGIDKPTDVLSFPQREPGTERVPRADALGDVVISVETAGRQAATLRHTLRDEVTRLLVHGVLHLVGFDHGNDREEVEMEDRAESILSALGERIFQEKEAVSPSSFRSSPNCG